MSDPFAEFEKQQKKLVLQYIFFGFFRFALLIAGFYFVQRLVEWVK